MDTVKGNLYQLCIKPKSISVKKQKLYKHTFRVNNIQIELMAKKIISARDGDFVIVAGIYNCGEFKAYSLKKPN